MKVHDFPRICSSSSKFLPLSVDTILEGGCHPGKQRKSGKLCLLVKMTEKYGGMSMHVKVHCYNFSELKQVIFTTYWYVRLQAYNADF